MAKQAWDVPTLRTIFTLDHPDFVCEPVVVKMNRHHFWITGQIETRNGEKAGSFTRRMIRRDLAWIAMHDTFAVDPVFRRRRIAFNHYRKALRAYRRLGCYRVEMYAQDYGPFVWPQFGFRCMSSADRQDLRRMLDRLHRERTGIELAAPPELEWEIVAVRSRSAEPLGSITAFRAALHHPNGALEMALDLNDPATLKYLVDRGIFDAKEIE